MSAVAYAAGAPDLASVALLAAIPACAAAALGFFGELVDSLDGEEIELVRLPQSALWGLALALLVVSAAVRAPLGEVPPLSTSAFSAALAAIALEGVLAAVLEVRGRTDRRAPSLRLGVERE